MPTEPIFRTQLPYGIAAPTQQQRGIGDPMAFLEDLLGNAPDFGDQARAEIDAIYGGQYDQIAQQENAARKRAGQNDAALAAMYKALGKDLKGQRGQIKGNFNSARKDVRAGYDQGRDNIAGAFEDANSQLADIFSQLGIEAAGADPRTLGANSRDSAMLQGLLQANSGASQNALVAQRQGSLDFNTDQQGIAKQEGTNQRSAMMRALEDKLAGFGQQRVSLDSQRAGALSDLTRSLENNWFTQQQKMAEQAYDAWAQQQQASGGATANGPTAYQQWNMMGPIDQAYSQAAKLFGQGDPRASQAVAMLTQLGGENQYHNAFEFVQAALEANRANSNADMTRALPEDQLRALAAFLYDRMNPQSLPSYVPN